MHLNPLISFGESYWTGERCTDFFFINSIIMALQPFVGPWPLLQFHNHFYTDGRSLWTSDQPVARPLPTHRTIQTRNKD
jgi:hypothetical protein